MSGVTPAIQVAQKNRGTIFVEDALLTEKHAYTGEQFMLRLAAPQCAQHAVAGSFVHLQCDQRIAMRRPLSIMRTNISEGWIEVLFKIVGSGLRALSQAEVGATLSVIGPIGRGFAAHPDRPQTLLIGGGVGIPPMVFLAEQLHEDEHYWQQLLLMGSEIPFPFAARPSSLAAAWLPDDINSCMPLLDDLGVCSRLASLAGFDGCYKGYVTDLARAWLESLTADERSQTGIFSCGPAPMLRVVAQLALEFELPCQVSLEEFMACGVGGCAGCTVEVHTAAGSAMRRVCVDGPVFEAGSVFAG